jgi:hypothetical protein
LFCKIFIFIFTKALTRVFAKIPRYHEIYPTIDLGSTYPCLSNNELNYYIFISIDREYSSRFNVFLHTIFLFFVEISWNFQHF